MFGPDDSASVLEIAQIGEPFLRASARRLTPEEIQTRRVKDLVEAMRRTMHNASGVGLAAPQIRESLQLAIIEDRTEYMEGLSPEQAAQRERVPVPFHVIINPIIEERGA